MGAENAGRNTCPCRCDPSSCCVDHSVRCVSDCVRSRRVAAGLMLELERGTWNLKPFWQLERRQALDFKPKSVTVRFYPIVAPTGGRLHTTSWPLSNHPADLYKFINIALTILNPNHSPLFNIPSKWQTVHPKIAWLQYIGPRSNHHTTDAKKGSCKWPPSPSSYILVNKCP